MLPFPLINLIDLSLLFSNNTNNDRVYIVLFVETVARYLLLKRDAVRQEHLVTFVTVSGILAGNPIIGKPTSCGLNGSKVFQINAMSIIGRRNDYHVDRARVSIRFPIELFVARDVRRPGNVGKRKEI